MIELLQYWTRMAIPMAFDDSYDDLEFKGKVLAKVNELITANNAYFSVDIITHVTALLNAWELDGTLAGLINDAMNTRIDAVSVEVDVNKAAQIIVNGANETRLTDAETQIDAVSVEVDVNKAAQIIVNGANETRLTDAETQIDGLSAEITSLASGSPKGTYATVAALEAAFPAGNASIYVVTADGTWRYYTGSAWASGGTYQSTGVADGSVTPEKLSFDPVQGSLSGNLFNKATVTDGYYITPGGSILENAAYCYSDFIPVIPGTQYIAEFINQGASYDVDKVLISGAGFGTDTVQPFTTDASAVFIRLSCPIVQKDLQQVKRGAVIGNYEAYGVTSLLPTAIIQIANVVNTDYLKQVLKHLANPFVKTRIKLIGDSITAGAGGTGFSETGDLIPSGTTHMNLTTGVCWANMLYAFVAAKFNADHYVSMDDENIVYNIHGAFVTDYGSAYLLMSYLDLDNSSMIKGLKFPIHADQFSIIYTARAIGGIVDVYVDGVKVDTLDTYAATTGYQSEKVVTGLGLTDHIVEIRETNTKNASASQKFVRLEGLKIRKTASVVNWGISGSTSGGVLGTVAERMEVADSFIFIQIGTNDRGYYVSPEALKANLRRTVEYIRDNLTAIPVLMSANPSSLANDALYDWKMCEVDMAIAAVSADLNIPYISNYDAFIQYSERTGTPINSMLEAGGLLHPNDLGYLVMYNNIARSIGLPILRDGMTV